MRPSRVVLPLVLVCAAPAAAAGPARTVTADYTGPSLVVVSPQQLLGMQCGLSCASFSVLRGERRAVVTVVDVTGRDVGWVATEDRDLRKTGCGSAPLSLREAHDWHVAPAVVPGCAAPPTRGQITVRISR